MRFKIDENLPRQLAGVFDTYGHDADTVLDEGLAGEPDSQVWHAAVDAQRALVTADLDFSDVRLYLPGTHPGVVLFRDVPADLGSILRAFERVLSSHDPASWARCVVVISAGKIRVRRPTRSGHEEG